MIICLGPVCVPLHLLLPFLLGILHSYGWFTWIKKEWLTFRYWKKRFDRWRGVEAPPPAAKVAAGAGVTVGAVPPVGPMAAVAATGSAGGDEAGVPEGDGSVLPAAGFASDPTGGPRHRAAASKAATE